MLGSHPDPTIPEKNGLCNGSVRFFYGMDFFLGFMEWITTIVPLSMPKMHKTAFPLWNGNGAKFECYVKQRKSTFYGMERAAKPGARNKTSQDILKNIYC